MNTFSHVPPGFRFHPTDEELVDYYLRKKIASKIDVDVIKDVDLYKIEPWDLQELCKIGNEEQSEWYFFSHKDKKYPTGTRTNRATKAGFWKATGRDKAIYSRHCLIGMRKTLVFYKGRAPNGLKSDWIMHEYRLETNENATAQEEGWVVCRVFKKRMATVRKMGEYDDSANCWYEEQVCFLESPRPNSICAYASSNNYHHHHGQHYPCKQELEHLQYNNMININHDAAALFLQLPQLESPKVPHPQSVPYNNNSASVVLRSSLSTQQQEQEQEQEQEAADLHLLYCGGTNNNNINDEQQQQVTDWRVLDKFVASQLSHDQHNNASAASKETTTNYSSPNNINNVAQHIAMLANGSSNEFDASTSTSSSHIDLWK